ncbi:MAG: hypothetical protein K2N34_00795, partial [Lachnospiraceae bacterium]|nr:hypothetical protein [Lachnospiraceae bacterium]
MDNKFDNNMSEEIDEGKMWFENFDSQSENESSQKEEQPEENNLSENVPSVKKVKSNIGIKLYALFVTLAAGAAIFAAGYFFNESKAEDGKTVNAKAENSTLSGEEAKPKEEITDSQIKATIREYMESGKGTMAMLRELFPENVVVVDSNKYLFLPIYDNVKKNTIDNANIKQLDNGELVYMEGEKQISHKGIDVSKFQGEIDWNKVAASGVEFAIVRLGYRGYGTGAIVMDETAIQNIEGALGANIKVGVYFFSQAVTIQEAVEEAE